ncbi:MAG TPA: universal stress protein [Gemmatimonadota bacterium]|nr:universal stress protein [Gemmatimonadota bacterium]
MFNRILVPTDGSESASAAAGYAIQLATAFDSTLVAIHVVDVRLIEGPVVQTIGSMWGDIPLPVRQEGVTRTLRERGTALLEEFVGRAQEAGRPVETALETGLASEVIVDRARGVDLVVMGRRGEYADFGSHAVGATVAAVARRSPRPVLVCPRGSDALMRPLVAYDGSDHATRALEIAVEYAETRGCPLHLVCVREEIDEARRTLDEASDYARGHAVEPILLPKEGDAVPERILEAAGDVEADFLVMGSFGKSRLKQFLLGSTTETLLESFNHPILLYR